ncbi:MAG: hypothetical protein K5682_12015 [Lachnospiraceae bacterium]|nr:hypothetical protein [Lachnospiraceae bacterium]
MKRRLLIMILGVLLSLTACGQQENNVQNETQITEETTVTGTPEAESTPEETEGTVASETTQTWSEVTLPEDGERYDSADGSVTLWLDPGKAEGEENALIRDGELLIPVDITKGTYAPSIEKADIDGDEVPEYLISECEGSGTGFCQYGLCVVKKDGEDYTLLRYDAAYFAEILGDRLLYDYDKEAHRVDLYADEEPVDAYIYIDPEYELEDIIWQDILSIRLLDGTPWLQASAGFKYTDMGAPLYEPELNVTAPVYVEPDGSVQVGTLRPFLVEHYDETIEEIGKETEIYHYDGDVTHDGIPDRICVTYLTEADFEGEISEDDFYNGGMGYIKVLSGQTPEDNSEVIFSEDPLWMREYAVAHVGNIQAFVTPVEDKCYLIVTDLYQGQGGCEYSYEAFFVGDGCVYSVDSGIYDFEEEDPDTKEQFFNMVYEWINDDSVLLMAADIDLEDAVLYSTEGNNINPAVYYDQKQ